MEQKLIAQESSQEGFNNVDEGSIIIGFLLGYLLSLIGLGVAIIMKKSKTIKGAWYGFVVGLLSSAIGGYLLFLLLMKIYSGQSS
jgi:uncharacterized membrane protein